MVENRRIEDTALNIQIIGVYLYSWKKKHRTKERGKRGGEKKVLLTARCVRKK